MNIDELTDETKSVMLARLMGWTVTDTGFRGRIVGPPDIIWSCGVASLYSPKNMSLAWRVHLWTNEVDDNDNDSKYRLFVDYREWWRDAVIGCYIWNSDNWQRAWLDKILSLAIEAGLVKDK